MNHRERLLLIGYPVRHSLSPIIQNAALDAAGIALRYETLDVAPEGLAATLKELASINSAGNITSPHKLAAMGSMGAVSASAAGTGVVNTFWSDMDGHMAGDNTDVAGFDYLAQQTLGEIPRDCRIAVLGSGGGAAAVLAAIRDWAGCTATVHARSPERAGTLTRRFSGFARAGTMSDAAISTADIVVNATPIGLFDDAKPVDLARLSRNAAIIDLVYGPDETAWVRNARARGHRTSDGLPMLVRQGALAFRKWFGVDPDEEAMWAAVLKETGRKKAPGGNLLPT